MENELNRIRGQISALPEDKIYYKKGSRTNSFILKDYSKLHVYENEKKPAVKSINKFPVLIKALLKKEYLQSKVSIMDKNKALLSNVLIQYEPVTEENIFSKLPLRCKKIPYNEFQKAIAVQRILPSPDKSSEIPIKTLKVLFDEDDEYAWGKAPYRENTKNQETKVHQGSNGAFYRSMAEMTIASIYEKLGIPYHYDEVYIVSPGGRFMDGYSQHKTWISPDFVFVNKAGRFIYHEHLGKTTFDEYMKRNIAKLTDYASCGITLGNNLLITSNDDDGGLNLKKIEGLIKDYYQ